MRCLYLHIYQKSLPPNNGSGDDSIFKKIAGTSIVGINKNDICLI